VLKRIGSVIAAFLVLILDIYFGFLLYGCMVLAPSRVNDFIPSFVASISGLIIGLIVLWKLLLIALEKE
jgi:hypothetical protein